VFLYAQKEELSGLGNDMKSNVEMPRQQRPHLALVKTTAATIRAGQHHLLPALLIR
jgi:hypothetical protein